MEDYGKIRAITENFIAGSCRKIQTHEKTCPKVTDYCKKTYVFIFTNNYVYLFSQKYLRSFHDKSDHNLGENYSLFRKVTDTESLKQLHRTSCPYVL